MNVGNLIDGACDEAAAPAPRWLFFVPPPTCMLHCNIVQEVAVTSGGSLGWVAYVLVPESFMYGGVGRE